MNVREERDRDWAKLVVLWTLVYFLFRKFMPSIIYFQINYFTITITQEYYKLHIHPITHIILNKICKQATIILQQSETDDKTLAKILQFYLQLGKMASFNTYDYQFLIKCLTEGSLAFKGQSIKRLTTLAQNDKKQFQANCKSILAGMQELYLQQRDDLNILCTLLLSEIVLGIISKENEQAIKSRHLKYLIYNLGHPSKPSIRKASHTSLLAYIKTYHNFDMMLEEYVEAGFDHENLLIKQKSINSFQSIFILEMRYFNWPSEPSRRLLQNMITKAGDDNLQIAKAAAQCLLSLCKNEGVKQTAQNMSIGYLHKLQEFLATTEQKIPNADLKINADDIKEIIETQRKKQKVEQSAKPEPTEQGPSIELKTLQQTTQNLTYQRRLQKIKKSIAASEEKEKKPEKEQPAGMNFAKMFSNINNESSLKERTQAVEDILFKIQSNRNKPEFQSSIKAALPNILRLLKDPNPRIVGLTLRILQSIVQQIKSSDAQLQSLITVIIQKLGDPKISIRQMVSKVIRQLISKTEKGMWIRELLENIRRNTNTFLKDETLNIIHNIYEENQITDVNYPVDELVEKIVVFTDDPKTKIKIRTLDCLAQIVFKSGDIQRHNSFLKKSMSEVFYQMYMEKINKFIQEKERKNMLELQKKRKAEQSNNFRSTYQEKPSHYRKQDSEDENKLNVSLDVVKKRINSLKKKRNALSTQQTSSLDRTYRTIEKIDQSNIDDEQIMLPVLAKNAQTHKLTQRKKFDGSPMKTIDNKNSDYMTKQQLKPLNEPDKQFKNVLFDLKSTDWKVQFDTINKMRRLTQFNPELILSAPSTNLHVIILDLLALIESLRSSVSKNALICLNQVILALGKQVDSQMQIILQKLMKKSADTNIFISSEVQKCLRTLSLTATPSKILQKLSIYKDSKNFPIKDALINTLLIMKDEQKIRSKQYGKLSEAMASFLSQGQIDLRSKAKSGIIDICNKLGDWYRFLRGKVSSSAFKLICDLMTKNSTGSIQTPEVSLTPAKPKKQLNASMDLKSLTIESKFNERQDSSIKDETRRGTRKNFVKVQQFPNQFGQIQGLIDLSSSSQWKKRIESTQGLKLLALKYPNQFVQYRSSCHFMDILSKQIVEPNIKVSVSAMQIFLEVLDPLQKLVENNMSVVCNSIFNSLSSAKVQVKQMAQKCTNSLIDQFQIQAILQHMCHGIMYSLPKSRIYLLNKLQDQVQQIHNERKQLLFKHVFPLLNKLMEQYKSQLMPHVVNFFMRMYEIMGNNMFSHVTKFKEVRELIDK